MRVGIIGGGFIGSYIAWRLAEEHQVYVFEREKKPGKDSCSGLISGRIWDFIPRNNKLIKNTIDSVNIHFPKKEVSVNFYPNYFVIDRLKLDDYMMDMAMKKGAKYFFNTNFRKLFYFKNKKPQIAVRSKEKSFVYEFDVVIGADGAMSAVRNQITKKEPYMRLGIKTYAKKYDKSKEVDVWPTINGFYWKIPRGSNIEYGIFEKPSVALLLFKKFSKRLGVKPDKVYSSLIPSGLVTGKRNVALCGDAAGLTKPWSGGGIIWGLYAADKLCEKFPDISGYNLWLERFYMPRFFFSRSFTKLVTFFGRHFPFLIPKKNSIDPDWVF